jgi:predicted site-specific integrase-resolvase
MTASKAAKEIGVSSNTILNWFKKGKLSGKRYSGMVWVRLADVEKLNQESVKNHQRRRYMES